MSKEDKIKIKLARIQGEYIGTLKGILWWDIPNELKERLKARIVELENQNKDEQRREMSKNVVTHKKGKEIIIGSVNEKNEFRYDIDFDMSLLSREKRKYLEETYNIKYRWKDRDESMKKRGWHYLSDW